MSADGLLVAHAVGGGIPPASNETLRVYESGIARAVVGNAWPFGAPQDEAGSYEHALAPADLAVLVEAIVAADGFEPARTPTEPAAGSCASATGAGPCGRRPPRRRRGSPRSSSACAASRPRRGATRWARSR